MRSLASARARSDVSRIVRRAARDLTRADGITFVVREGDEVHYVDEDAVAPLWQGRRFRLGECISGWVVQNRAPVVVPDVFADPRVPHDAYRPTFVKSMAMVPIRSEDPIGALGAYWRAPHVADPRETALLQTIADAAAASLDNVRLLSREHEARVAAEEEARLRNELLAIVSH